MLIRDKFLRGVFSGLAGGIVKDIFGVILVYLIKLTTVSYWDYAGYVI